MNVRMPGEKRVHRSAKLPNSFAVDNAKLVNATFAAQFNIVEHDWLYVFGAKGMEVQDTVDWYFYRLLSVISKFRIHDNT